MAVRHGRSASLHRATAPFKLFARSIVDHTDRRKLYWVTTIGRQSVAFADRARICGTQSAACQ